MAGLKVNIYKALQKSHPPWRDKIAIMLHDITYFFAIVKLGAMAMCGVENV